MQHPISTAPRSPDKRARIAFAMSGGVDSSAAAILLAEKGWEVVGISMQVWDYRKGGGNAGKATCCAPADFDDARAIADNIGFPFYVFDFEDSFEDAVIAPFVSSYLSGETPNPCLDCNRKVKFRELRRRALSLGVPMVATGHYAQIKRRDGRRFALCSAKDRKKDQTYFLYSLNQEDLAHVVFPVGSMEKPDVRRFLRDRGIEAASKKESQDICFVSSSVPDFVERYSKTPPRPGRFVDRAGRTVGEHGGVHRFTVGQRRGLGLSARRPLYVLEVDPETSNVTIGERHELGRTGFSVRGVHWVSGQAPEPRTRVIAKLRYRHRGVLCEVRAIGDGRAEATFVDEWSTVSPGQAAVFYHPDPDAEGDMEVLGGGILEREET